MTASEAKKKLNELKTAILADGKVDMTEANVLLEFIDDYIGCDKFMQLKQLLVLCKEDAKITEEESAQIAQELDRTIKHLTIEDICEKVIIYGIIGLIATMFLLKLIW